MNKVPHIERDMITGGLTNDCAALWYKFLAEEFDWQGNRSLSDYYKRRSEELSRAPRGSIHDRRLEEAIKTWKR